MKRIGSFFLLIFALLCGGCANLQGYPGAPRDRAQLAQLTVLSSAILADINGFPIHQREPTLPSTYDVPAGEVLGHVKIASLIDTTQSTSSRTVRWVSEDGFAFTFQAEPGHRYELRTPLYTDQMVLHVYVSDLTTGQRVFSHEYSVR